MLLSFLWKWGVCNKKVIGWIWNYMYSFWCVVNIALLTSRNISPNQNSYIYFHIQPKIYKYKTLLLVGDTCNILFVHPTWSIPGAVFVSLHLETGAGSWKRNNSSSLLFCICLCVSTAFINISSSWLIFVWYWWNMSTNCLEPSKTPWACTPSWTKRFFFRNRMQIYWKRCVLLKTFKTI